MDRVVVEIDGVRHVLRNSPDFVCGQSCSLYDVCDPLDGCLCELATAVGVPEDHTFGYYFEVESKLED